MRIIDISQPVGTATAVWPGDRPFQLEWSMSRGRGDSVNVAARLQGLAKPGEVLVSETTYRQVKGKVLATPMEPMTLKGKRIPVGVYRIDSLLEI